MVRVLWVGLFAGAALLLAGCGGGSSTTTPPSQAVAITAQPKSQTVPIGRTATFSVTATGTAPLSYQWSENGSTIPGATSASYTTPTVELGSDGSTSIGSFQVTVSNASSSATSDTAMLTAGPRAPALGDLRYLACEQVNDPNFLTTDAFCMMFGFPVNTTAVEESIQNALGAPYEMYAGGCLSDLASYWPLPQGTTGLSTYYEYDNPGIVPYPTYLESVAAPNVVINSIDLELFTSIDGEPGCGLSVSWIQTTGTGGFDYKMESVPPSQLQSTVAADGAASRIVTAVTFDDSTGNAVVISYGWQGDTTTMYDAETVITTPDNVFSAAMTLAAEGYFISAFGGNGTDGYMLIGMRVQGDTMPRPTAYIVGNTLTVAPSADTNAPFTVVVWLALTPGWNTGPLIEEQ